MLDFCASSRELNRKEKEKCRKVEGVELEKKKYIYIVFAD